MSRITQKSKAKKIWKEALNGYDPWKNSDLYYFDQEVAEAVCDFFPSNLRHSKGEWAGKIFKLEKWQKKYVGHLFGWKRKDNGFRRYRTTLLFIPKKNGKTQLAAGIGIILLSADNEPGAEIYATAGDTDQAKIIFDAASEMVEANEKLDRNIQVFKGYKAMKFDATQSYWKVFSSEAKTKHGPNVHGLLVDELHVQRNMELIDTLTAGVVARRQPLIVYMTTADHAGPSVCNDEYDYACKVRDGVIDDGEYLPFIYEANVDDNWKLVKTWKKANPNLGISLPMSYFKSLVKKAINKPSEENKFKRLHLNIQTKTENRWIEMEKWDASGCKMDQKELDGKECFAGLDLSSSIDIASFVLYFPEYYACLPWFWVPKKTAEKRIEYSQWAKQKYVDITDGDVVDYDWIRKQINELSHKYKILDIAYDPWNASQMAIKLTDEDGLPMIEFRQGFKSFNEPSKEFEKLITEKKIIHFGNPVMRWMASNCSIKEDPAGNIKPIKPAKNSPLKVDGIVALIMGIGLSINRQEDEPEENIYNERGLITI